MSVSDIHYLTFEPSEIWNAMIDAYIEQGGDVLYPGDEKEILLRGVEAMLMLTMAGVDNALRMHTLRFAAGEYLDLYGEGRSCPRIEAAAARGRVKISFLPTGHTSVLSAGTQMTADGVRFYALTEDVTHTGEAQEVTASVVCTEKGAKGNGITAGTALQLAVVNAAVYGITAMEDIAGGEEREDDETYRERIRLSGLASNTTGPASQYEKAAMRVTSEIADAKASNNGAGEVLVCLLLRSEEGAGAILKRVEDALNPLDTRPLTDHVTVRLARDIPYVLHVRCKTDLNADGNLTQALMQAAAEYQDWQDHGIGRAFNPDRLLANLYKAGATRVVYEKDSHFNGGAVEYTEIAHDARCKGTIHVEVMS